MGFNTTANMIRGSDSKQPTASSTGGKTRPHFATYILYSVLCIISILNLANMFGQKVNLYPVLNHSNDTSASFDWERVRLTRLCSYIFYKLSSDETRDRT